MDGYEFALCLTHDVDRPYKRFQVPYYAIKDRDLAHFRTLFTSERPYWQFQNIMELEEQFDVRSSFYFLNEQRLFRDKGMREWIRPENWKLFTGRYDITDDEIVTVISTLDDGGWEIGLHGSYESCQDYERLQYEKETLESIVGHEVVGVRQHYLNLDRPKTWEFHRTLGLKYDSSLGSTDEYGFQFGYGPVEPLDGFYVFPITVMEVALMRTCDNVAEAKAEIDALLTEAQSEGAVMTALWHPRFFNESEFPGYADVYRYMIRNATEMGAFVGSCADVYDRVLS